MSEDGYTSPAAFWESASLGRLRQTCTVVTFDEAVELVTTFVTLPMDRSAEHLRWIAADRAWRTLSGPADRARARLLEG
jgi:hypothetical protein